MFFQERIVDDFAGVRWRVLRAAEAGLVAVAAALFAVDAEPTPPAVLLPLVAYFVVLQAYVAYRFVQAARQLRGVTQRRMQAAAAGSALLGSLILVAGVSAVAPGEDVWTALSRVTGLASGIAYLVAFAPPALLRHAWQEPELRRFLARASELPRLPDLPSMVAVIEAGAASSVGVGRAAVLLWGEREARLVSPTMPAASVPPDGIAMQAFASQRPVFVEDTVRQYPEYRDVYERADARAIVAAPITAGDLVLLDMRMPVHDGWEVARGTRTRGLRIPILVMTAAQNARQWAEEIEADGYIPKPFDVDELLNAIARLIPPQGERGVEETDRFFAVLGRWLAPGARPLTANGLQRGASAPAQ